MILSRLLAFVVIVGLASSIRANATDDTVEVTATGVGTTTEAAEKNALINAVQQAVGLYVDGETLVKNDQVVYEKVLSASSGFITTYKTTVPTRKRASDGLFETTVRAVVQKNKVADELRKAKIPMTAVTIPGEDLWAEAVTRINKAEDGRKLLTDLLEEAQLGLLKARLVGNDGKPGNDASRPTLVPLDGKAASVLGWNIEITYDRDRYFTHTAPRLEKLLAVISEERGATPLTIRTPTTLRENTRRSTSATGLSKQAARYWTPAAMAESLGLERLSKTDLDRNASIYVLVNTSFDRDKENCTYKWYRLNAAEYHRVFSTLAKSSVVDEVEHVQIRLMHKDDSTLATQYLDIRSTLASDPERIARFKTITLDGVHEYNRLRRRSLVTYEDYSYIFPKKERNKTEAWWRVPVVLISPEFVDSMGPGDNGFGGLIYDSLIVRHEVEMNNDDLKSIKELQFQIVRKK